jgi:N-acetylglucosamine-6-phosphate deacetylase
MMGTPLEQSVGRMAITNGRIVLPQAIVTGQAIVLEDDQIVGIAPSDSLSRDLPRVDVGERIITPGLIDLHTHGAVGHTFNEPTAKAFSAITEENARHGVTALLATLATASMADLVNCLRFCREWMQEPHVGARVLGIHMESPYISPAQKGALDPAHIRTPDDGTPDILLEHHDVLKIMVLAPELPGALGLIAKLVKLGIVAAAGHSSAQDEQVLAAMRVGLRHVTHIWSAMSSTLREGPWRKPGLLESALLFDDLTVEMIADNKHLPSTLMKLAYKCIGADRLCAVSDATSGAGLPEGTHFRMGGMEYEVHDGVGMLFDRTAFAGSTTLVSQMIPILSDVAGIPLVKAVRMLTLTPARIIGYGDRKGSLEPGKEADLAIFNDDWTAWRTMIGGRWVYAS